MPPNAKGGPQSICMPRKSGDYYSLIRTLESKTAALQAQLAQLQLENQVARLRHDLLGQLTAVSCLVLSVVAQSSAPAGAGLGCCISASQIRAITCIEACISHLLKDYQGVLHNTEISHAGPLKSPSTLDAPLATCLGDGQCLSLLHHALRLMQLYPSLFHWALDMTLETAGPSMYVVQGVLSHLLEQVEPSASRSRQQASPAPSMQRSTPSPAPATCSGSPSPSPCPPSPAAVSPLAPSLAAVLQQAKLDATAGGPGTVDGALGFVSVMGAVHELLDPAPAPGLPDSSPSRHKEQQQQQAQDDTEQQQSQQRIPVSAPTLHALIICWLQLLEQGDVSCPANGDATPPREHQGGQGVDPWGARSPTGNPAAEGCAPASIAIPSGTTVAAAPADGPAATAEQQQQQQQQLAALPGAWDTSAAPAAVQRSPQQQQQQQEQQQQQQPAVVAAATAADAPALQGSEKALADALLGIAPVIVLHFLLRPALIQSVTVQASRLLPDAQYRVITDQLRLTVQQLSSISAIAALYEELRLPFDLKQQQLLERQQQLEQLLCEAQHALPGGGDSSQLTAPAAAAAAAGGGGLHAEGSPGAAAAVVGPPGVSLPGAPPHWEVLGHQLSGSADHFQLMLQLCEELEQVSHVLAWYQCAQWCHVMGLLSVRQGATLMCSATPPVCWSRWLLQQLHTKQEWMLQAMHPRDEPPPRCKPRKQQQQQQTRSQQQLLLNATVRMQPVQQAAAPCGSTQTAAAGYLWDGMPPAATAAVDLYVRTATPPPAAAAAAVSPCDRAGTPPVAAAVVREAARGEPLMDHSSKGGSMAATMQLACTAAAHAGPQPAPGALTHNRALHLAAARINSTVGLWQHHPSRNGQQLPLEHRQQLPLEHTQQLPGEHRQQLPLEQTQQLLSPQPAPNPLVPPARLGFAAPAPAARPLPTASAAGGMLQAVPATAAVAPGGWPTPQQGSGGGDGGVSPLRQHLQVDARGAGTPPGQLRAVSTPPLDFRGAVTPPPALQGGAAPQPGAPDAVPSALTGDWAANSLAAACDPLSKAEGIGQLPPVGMTTLVGGWEANSLGAAWQLPNKGSGGQQQPVGSDRLQQAAGGSASAHQPAAALADVASKLLQELSGALLELEGPMDPASLDDLLTQLLSAP